MISYVLGIFLSFGMMLYTIWYNKLTSKKGRTSLKHIHIYIYTCEYTCICMYTYTYTYTCTYTLHISKRSSMYDYKETKGQSYAFSIQYSAEILCPGEECYSKSKIRLKVHTRHLSVTTMLCHSKYLNSW